MDGVTRWRVLAAWVAVATLAGAVWGGVRGWSYLPTFPVALIEGGLIFGVPAALGGVVLVGLYSLIRVVAPGRTRPSPPRTPPAR